LAQVLAEKMGIVFQQRNEGTYGLGTLAGKKNYIFVPSTYMNLSGQALQKFIHFFKIPCTETLVLHDDLELPFGSFMLKYSGGHGGHNGIRDIEKACGSKDFWRLRLGIGRPQKGDVASWVLSRFSPQEEAVLPAIFDYLCDYIKNLDPQVNTKKFSFFDA